ncbi:hypothetical protein PINS_up016003, partial [Pythium insidiosum]
ATNLASFADHAHQHQSLGGDGHGLSKSLSIGDGLSAYFPRIQSLEHLSSLLQEHAPVSPKPKAESAEPQEPEARD